jgi:hypothetical protein
MFVRDRALMGQRFDLRTATLRGDAHPLADIVSVFPSAGAAAITASATALVYRDADELAIRNSQLLWITRLGSIVGKIGEVADYSTINLSRDDKKLAIALRGQTTKNLDLWIGDVERGITSPFVVGASGNFDPQWSPTSEIAFSSDRNGASSIFRKSSTGRGDPSEVVQQGEAVMVSDWSRDGRFLLYQSASGERVFAAAVDVHPPKPSLFIESPTAKDQLHFSPDGQWVAYGGNDAGRFEVFVVGFPIAGQPIRVSVDGGVQPRWRSDGKELFYLKQDGTMMAVAVRVPGSGAIEFGEPRALFRTGLSSPAWDIEQYDVTADGQRFIIITPPNESTGKFMNLLLNWRLRLE